MFILIYFIVSNTMYVNKITTHFSVPISMHNNLNASLINRLIVSLFHVNCFIRRKCKVSSEKSLFKLFTNEFPLKTIKNDVYVSNKNFGSSIHKQKLIHDFQNEITYQFIKLKKLLNTNYIYIETVA